MYLKSRESLSSGIWHIVGSQQYLLSEVETNETDWCALLWGGDAGAGEKNLVGSFIVFLIQPVEFHRDMTAVQHAVSILLPFAFSK